MKTLKDFIVTYQEGEERALEDLITYKTRPVNNVQMVDGIRKKAKSRIHYLHFTDYRMNTLLYSMKEKYHWIDEGDVDEAFLSLFYKILPKVDTTKTPAEVVSYVTKRIRFKMNDEIKNLDLSDHEISEFMPAQREQYTGEKADESGSVYNDFQLYDWKLMESGNHYHDFLKHIGGIENVLTEEQKKVFKMHEQHMTQEDIATELSKTQNTVSLTIQRAKQNVAHAWITFRTVKALQEDSTAYNAIQNFLEYYYALDDVAQNVDYFAFVVQFLRKHIHKDDTNFELMQENKVDYRMSVIDVLYDYMKGNMVVRLIQYLQGTISLQRNEKDRMTKRVIKAFMEFLEEGISPDSKGIERQLKVFYDREIKNNINEYIEEDRKINDTY
ncbi:sigma factor-like helix-turn-helix DNA-binding protein [Salibacterium lacus]|uniref:Sigma factor-like helix-turn-helix DNA-binding protein n=1 Tax=Salibacterium lacus TaxID=1898109 RepID=A0ABW5SXN2_9BACI